MLETHGPTRFSGPVILSAGAPADRKLAQLTRRHAPLWLLLAVFLLLIIFIDRDRPNMVLDAYYYLMLVAFFMTLSASDARILSQSWIIRLCMGYLAFMWLTPLWTSGLKEAAWGAVALGSVRIVLFVTMTAYMVFSRDDHIDWLLQFLGWAALGTSIYSLVSFYTQHDLSERLALAWWPNPNTGAAVFGLLAVGVGLGSALRVRASVQCRAVYAIIALVLVACVFLAGTRSVLVGIAASALGYVLLSSEITRKTVLGIAILCLVGIVTAYTLPITGHRGDTRLGLWLGFWDIAREHFWLGHGIQNEFKYVALQNGDPYSSPHNMLLTALLYGGVFALLILMTLYIAAIVVAVRYHRRGGSLAPMAMSIYLFVHGMFETIAITSPGLSSPGWRWLYLWWLIGAIAGLELRLKLGLSPRRAERSPATFLVGLSLRLAGGRHSSAVGPVSVRVTLPKT